MRKVPYPHPGEILLEEFLKPMGITKTLAKISASLFGGKEKQAAPPIPKNSITMMPPQAPVTEVAERSIGDGAALGLPRSLHPGGRSTAWE